MKRSYKLLIIIFCIVLFSVFILSAKVYKYPDSKELGMRIKYLERVINSPLNDKNDLILIGYENPEWKLFSLSFTTYGFTNVALKDDSFKELAIEDIEKALSELSQ